ncbi:FAD binding domain-containing protein [Streptomyces sp. NPDC006332]|uniref:FAD binding domain-containing protein n=1 Tax=Streptomyces sp. NPDC006332 TaxID=3155456 RepID=UPI0033BA1B05
MKELRYQRAADVPGAIALLAADPAARVLGGGTKPVALMKRCTERPARLFDIRRLPLSGSWRPVGAAAPRPWRTRRAYRLLMGRPVEAEGFAETADGELAAVRPPADNAYKVTLIRNLVVSELTTLAQEGTR